jgi:hypothetical protein
MEGNRRPSKKKKPSKSSTDPSPNGLSLRQRAFINCVDPDSGQCYCEIDRRCLLTSKMKRRISSGSNLRSFLTPIQKILFGFLVIGVLQSEAFNTQLSHSTKPNAPSTIPSRLAHVGFQSQRSPALLTKSNSNLEEVSCLLVFFTLYIV